MVLGMDINRENALGNLPLMGLKFVSSATGIPVDATVDALAASAPGQSAMNIGKTMFNLATGKTSMQDHLATMTPDQILDGMVANNPQWKDTVEVIRADDEFKNAFKDALVTDKTFLPGLLNMTKGQAGQTALPVVAEQLKNPEHRGNITAVLQNVANGDANFADFERETTNMMTQGFWKDILKHPERLGGMIGSVLENIGLPPALVESIAGFFPKIFNAIAAAPGFIKDIAYDEYPEAQNFVRNHISPVLQEGREHIATYNTPSI